MDAISECTANVLLLGSCGGLYLHPNINLQQCYAVKLICVFREAKEVQVEFFAFYNSSGSKELFALLDLGKENKRN